MRSVSDLTAAICSEVGGIGVVVDAAGIVSITEASAMACEQNNDSTANPPVDVAICLGIREQAMHRRCVTARTPRGDCTLILGASLELVQIEEGARMPPPALLRETFAANGWRGLALVDRRIHLLLSASDLASVTAPDPAEEETP